MEQGTINCMIDWCSVLSLRERVERTVSGGNRAAGGQRSVIPWQKWTGKNMSVHLIWWLNCRSEHRWQYFNKACFNLSSCQSIQVILDRMKDWNGKLFRFRVDMSMTVYMYKTWVILWECQRCTLPLWALPNQALWDVDVEGRFIVEFADSNTCTDGGPCCHAGETSPECVWWWFKLLYIEFSMHPGCAASPSPRVQSDWLQAAEAA